MILKNTKSQLKMRVRAGFQSMKCFVCNATSNRFLICSTDCLPALLAKIYELK